MESLKSIGGAWTLVFSSTTSINYMYYNHVSDIEYNQSFTCNIGKSQDVTHALVTGPRTRG